ncbi:MAG: hypothetical protein WC755_06175 [Candidatus Woesearchaeota archaeon]|jgi:hypothetical protein
MKYSLLIFIILAHFVNTQKFEVVFFVDAAGSEYKILQDPRIAISISLKAQYIECAGLTISDAPDRGTWNLVYNIPAILASNNQDEIIPEILYRTTESIGNSAFELCVMTNMIRAVYHDDSLDPKILTAFIISVMNMSIFLLVLSVTCIFCISCICCKIIKKQPIFI